MKSVIIGNATLHLGDCLEILHTLPADSADSIVTDPPYGLGKEPDAMAMLADWLATGHHDVKGTGFMGKDWDAFVPQPALWRECLRVLKPGGHLLAFAGTRTHDLMTLGLRIAGFEIRDTIMWVYGSGFPKSMNVANAIHDAAIGQPQGGAKPGSKNHGRFKGGCSGENETGRGFGAGPGQFMAETGEKAERELVESARQWEGWGTALKPALEPITLARKPLIGTVAANVLAHGTGGLNIDGCRVEALGEKIENHGRSATKNGWDPRMSGGQEQGQSPGQALGRWPANLIHDGSDEVLAGFPSKAGASAPASGPTHEGASKSGSMAGHFNGMGERAPAFHGDTGSAARFFYCAKASKADREEGLERFDDAILARSCQAQAEAARGNTIDEGDGAYNKARIRKNNHPTVKPTDLMRYLCRLVTPPGGTVLDPFTGSGSTGKAAVIEGFRFIGIEREAKYFDIACRRIEDAQLQGRLIA